MAFRGMPNEIFSFDYFGKAKTDKSSVIAFRCMWMCCIEYVPAKRNHLEKAKRGDLKLKLTKLEPRIKRLCNHHQAQSPS